MNEQTITVQVAVQYLDDRSLPEKDHFMFAYTITITNNGHQPVQLLARHWLITDANGQKSEVEGPGVVGEKPVIGAGQDYTYTSSAVLPTPLGTMQGKYDFAADDGQPFSAPIPCFRLAKPGIVH